MAGNTNIAGVLQSGHIRLTSQTWASGGPGPHPAHESLGEHKRPSGVVRAAGEQFSALFGAGHCGSADNARRAARRHPSRQGARRIAQEKAIPTTRPVERLPCDFDSLGVLRFSLFPS